MEKDLLIKKIDKERAETLDVYNRIKEGTLSFDDFWYGWLDNIKNSAFGEGYQHAKDEMDDQ
jgi:hypothetical protein